jgi:hypothetical protein
MLRSFIALTVLTIVSGCHQCGETRLFSRAISPFYCAHTGESSVFKPCFSCRLPFSLNRNELGQNPPVVEKREVNSLVSEPKSQPPSPPVAAIDSNQTNDDLRTDSDSLTNNDLISVIDPNIKPESIPHNKLQSDLHNQLESNANEGPAQSVEPTQPSSTPQMDLPTAEEISHNPSAPVLTIDSSVGDVMEPDALALDSQTSIRHSTLRVITDRDRFLDLIVESTPQPAADESTVLRISQSSQQSDTASKVDTEIEITSSFPPVVQQSEDLPTAIENPDVNVDITLKARAVQPYQATIHNRAQLLDLESMRLAIPAKPLDVSQFNDTRFLADIDNNWRFDPLPNTTPFAAGIVDLKTGNFSSEYRFAPLPSVVTQDPNAVNHNSLQTLPTSQPSGTGSVTDVVVDLVAPQLDTNPATAARPIQKPGDRR